MAEKTYETVVTNVTVFPFRSNADTGKYKGLAQVVINDAFVVRDLRIAEGETGLYVAYPTDPESNGFRTIFNPITKELRRHIEACVLEEYHNVTD